MLNTISKKKKNFQYTFPRYGKAATGEVLCKKLFLKVSQSSQEKPVPESLFNVTTV